ncbi:tetratricopeptide repeat protein [Niveibacterium microcysteis]|uniref:Tetratricopeptide repeat protein n=1 Tax=Niveibacterium microcysteis TaxID=2811415 RepID=A0ABX7MEI2_9RHOO|nr:tetratricopeptide repeat protein [Niveibacterium microcysteis]
MKNSGRRFNTATSAASVCVALLLSACATTSQLSELDQFKDVAAVQQRVDELVASGDVQKAQAMLESTAKANPTDPAPWVRMAQLQFDRGNYSGTIAAADEAVQRDPANVQAKGWRSSPAFGSQCGIFKSCVVVSRSAAIRAAKLSDWRAPCARRSRRMYSFRSLRRTIRRRRGLRAALRSQQPPLPLLPRQPRLRRPQPSNLPPQRRLHRSPPLLQPKPLPTPSALSSNRPRYEQETNHGQEGKCSAEADPCAPAARAADL